MRVGLVPPVSMAGPDVRTFESGDVLALGGLMYRAYRDTVDDEGETPEKATAEIHETIQGAYGAFIPPARRWWHEQAPSCPQR